MIIIGFVALISSIKFFAYEGLTLIEFDASIRERLELWHGMNAKNYGDPNGVGDLKDNILFQRIIAGFNYTPNNK